MAKSYIPAELRRILREECRFRCGYCLTPSSYTGQQMVPDHLLPESRGGQTVHENLWLACRHCNEHKGNRTHTLDPLTITQVPLFNPRIQDWAIHFIWSDDGTQIQGVTAIGRATVEALNMNDEGIVTARSFWVEAGWHPPQD